MSAGRTLSSDWSVVLKWLSMNNVIFFKFSQFFLSKAELLINKVQGVGMAVKYNVE